MGLQVDWCGRHLARERFGGLSSGTRIFVADAVSLRLWRGVPPTVAHDLNPKRLSG